MTDAEFDKLTKYYDKFPFMLAGTIHDLMKDCIEQRNALRHEQILTKKLLNGTENVANLHAEKIGIEFSYCDECKNIWPCKTIKVLRNNLK